jgi:hypothetical protein
MSGEVDEIKASAKKNNYQKKPSNTPIMDNLTIGLTNSTIWNQEKNSNMPTTYNSMDNLFANYANENGKMTADRIAHLEADITASKVTKLTIGNEEFNIIDANDDAHKSSSTIEGTEGNDIFLCKNKGSATYNSNGGAHDLLLMPSDNNNTIRIIGGGQYSALATHDDPIKQETSAKPKGSVNQKQEMNDFIQSVAKFNNSDFDNESLQTGYSDNITAQSTGGSVWRKPANSNVKTTYSSIEELLGNYANKDGKLHADGVAHMKADFAASNIKEITVGNEKYNIIDADKQGLETNGTNGNDIFFGKVNGMTTYHSNGGKDILLNPHDLDNTVTVMGEIKENKIQNVKNEASAKQNDMTANSGKQNTQDTTISNPKISTPAVPASTPAVDEWGWEIPAEEKPQQNKKNEPLAIEQPQKTNISSEKKADDLENLPLNLELYLKDCIDDNSMRREIEDKLGITSFTDKDAKKNCDAIKRYIIDNIYNKDPELKARIDNGQYMQYNMENVEWPKCPITTYIPDTTSETATDSNKKRE